MPALLVPMMTVAWLALAGAGRTAEPQTDGPGKQPGQTREMDRLAILEQRNIFDPDRTRYRPGERRETPVEAPPRPEVLSLTGTFLSPEKTVAFFSGSDRQFQGVVAIQGEIGGLRVMRITSGGVVLGAGETRLELPVGRQLRREPGREWSMAERNTSFEEGSRSSSSGRSGSSYRSDGRTSSSASSAPSGDMSEVMKRLLERRQKETSQ